MDFAPNIENQIFARKDLAVGIGSGKVDNSADKDFGGSSWSCCQNTRWDGNRYYHKCIRFGDCSCFCYMVELSNHCTDYFCSFDFDYNTHHYPCHKYSSCRDYCYRNTFGCYCCSCDPKSSHLHTTILPRTHNCTTRYHTSPNTHQRNLSLTIVPHLLGQGSSPIRQVFLVALFRLAN